MSDKEARGFFVVVVLVSGVQQSDSVIHIHVAILFQIFSQILFPFRLLQILSRAPGEARGFLEGLQIP